MDASHREQISEPIEIQLRSIPYAPTMEPNKGRQLPALDISASALTLEVDRDIAYSNCNAQPYSSSQRSQRTDHQPIDRAGQSPATRLTETWAKGNAKRPQDPTFL
ncbi:hypothetical protein AVEN_194416-1 [Araneus ventricosus]|uniref:Uncharacterized protein n=1 Tax=Araneus ventricosus TaxID=182803 RepID=A0A4Y2A6G8_ARAVE|nr:hypothetical protein AVEN_194416-1 [Araneus ventricosus]